MPLLYHYTSHSNVKQIKRSGQINHSSGYFNRCGVWLTKLDPSRHSKREILFNNYEYRGERAEKKLYRAACYIEINIPDSPDTLEDLSHLRTHPNQDLWLWPNVPLVLDRFIHRFGVVEGREDPYLRYFFN